MESSPNRLAADAGSRIVLGKMMHERLSPKDVEEIVAVGAGPVDESGDTVGAKLDKVGREKYLAGQRSHQAALAASVLAEYLAFGQVEPEGRQAAINYLAGLMESPEAAARREGVSSTYEAGLLDNPLFRKKVEALTADKDETVRELAKMKLKQWETLRGEWLKSRGLRDVGIPE
ncbi:MAG: hypothetical protein K2X36_08645 [Microbacteriaceae bacterium]|nr:hypothetical protein [Microbacteriaceae bacterium]